MQATALVRHITPERLAGIDDLLGKLRALDGLVERSPGVFYRRSRAFLHFHEDGDDIYADVRLGGADFDRRRVSTRRAPFQRARGNPVRSRLRNWQVSRPTWCMTQLATRHSVAGTR